MKTECVQRKLGTRADDTVAKVSVTRFRFIRLPPKLVEARPSRGKKCW